MYGTMYVMHRTTVYLPEELKRRLALAAKRQRRTEADIIRSAIEVELANEPFHRPKPHLGIGSSGDPTLAERVHEILAKEWGGADNDGT